MATQAELQILIDATNALNSLKDVEKSLNDVKNTAAQVGSGGAGLKDLTGNANEAKQAFSNLANAAQNPIGAVTSLEAAFTSLLNPITAVSAAVAALVAGGFSLANAAIEAADNLHTLQMQTGLTVEQIQTMQYVAEEAGSSFDSLSSVTEKFAKNMTKDSKDFAAAMEWLGVSTVDSTGKLKDQFTIMNEVAVALNETTESASKHAAAQAILGKSYKEAMPALLELNTAREKEALLNETGAMQSQAMADAADNLGDTWTKLGKVWDGVGNQLAESLLPLLQGVADALVNSAQEGGALAGVIGALKIVFEAIVVVLKAAAVALIALDTGFQVLGKTIVATAQIAKAAATGDFGAISGIWNKYTADMTEAATKSRDAMATIVNGYDGLKKASDSVAPVIQKERGELEKSTEAKEKHSKATDQSAKATENARDKLNDYIAKLQDEYNTIGMSKEQREQYNEVRKIENMLAEKNVNLSEAEKKAYMDTALALQEKINVAREAQEQQEKTQKATADAVSSIEEYIDSLHREAEAAGMSAENAEQYNAVQKATAILRKENVDLTEEQIAAYEAQIETEIKLKQENTARIKAEQEAEKAKQEAIREEYKKSEGAFAYMLDQATPALEKFFGLHKGTIGKVVEVFKGLGITLKDILGPQTYDALIGMTSQFRQGLIGAMQSLFGAITDQGSGFMKGLVELGKNALSWLSSAASSILGGVGNAIGSIFGGGGGGDDDSGGIWDTVKSVGGAILGGIGSLFGFADGGQVNRNEPYIVGERGPEIFMPATSGTIIPNNAYTTGRQSAGDVYFNFTVNGMPQQLMMDTSYLKEFATAILQETKQQIVNQQVNNLFSY